MVFFALSFPHIVARVISHIKIVSKPIPCRIKSKFLGVYQPLALTCLSILPFHFNPHPCQIHPHQVLQHSLTLSKTSPFPLLGLTSHCDLCWDYSPLPFHLSSLISIYGNPFCHLHQTFTSAGPSLVPWTRWPVKWASNTGQGSMEAPWKPCLCLSCCMQIPFTLVLGSNFHFSFVWEFLAYCYLGIS